jgi:hypothetical protein
MHDQRNAGVMPIKQSLVITAPYHAGCSIHDEAQTLSYLGEIEWRTGFQYRIDWIVRGIIFLPISEKGLSRIS